MTTTNHRHERVGEEIAHEINAMLAGELKDPRLEGSVVVSEVRLQPDMKHARVFVSVKGSNKEQMDAIKALEHAAGFIRSELIERLQLRRLPDMHFTLDTSQEHVERIEQLRAQAQQEIVAATDSETVERLRVHYLGRKAELPQILRGVAALEPDQRGAVGKAANDDRRAIEQQIEQHIEKETKGLGDRVDP